MGILMAARRYPPDVQSGTETVFAALYAQARAAARDGGAPGLVAGFVRDRALLPPEAVAVDLRRGSPWLRMARATWAEARRARAAGAPYAAALVNSVECVAPGLPTWLIVHDLNFGRAGRIGTAGLREALYRLRAAEARLIAVSAATRDRLVGIGVPPERVTVIPNGVDLDRLSPAPPPPGPITFAMVSRVIAGKGQHVAIDALGRMRPDQRKNLRLLIVGARVDRIYADQLQIQAYRLPVEFHFDVPDTAPLYRQAHAALFPTRMEEGFGYGAVEGMAAGLPVVWSEQPAIREATGGIGLPVPMDNADALRAAMLRLAGDAGLRADLGRAGRAFVEGRYGWPGVWARYAAAMGLGSAPGANR